ncbi:hypothetical protein SAMN05444141_102270 [Pseudovibrio denitrificans]|uniref:Uncharacterized protein n=1 Tax=Pseudovibrio denitrificans TaxID=258256 RepID=A0A1I6ZDR3_9HYPH|nr:hypothetical protein SAMN05444141_102270 [Pseudovibrio denitrificans]
MVHAFKKVDTPPSECQPKLHLEISECPIPSLIFIKINKITSETAEIIHCYKISQSFNRLKLEQLKYISEGPQRKSQYFLLILTQAGY